MSFKKTTRALIFPIAVGGALANYYYHHRNYIASRFITNWKYPFDEEDEKFRSKMVDFVAIEKEAGDIESKFSRYPRRPLEMGGFFKEYQ